MKKIKILHGFLVMLILLYVTHFYTTLFIMPNFVDIFENKIFGVSQFYLEFGFSILLFLGLIFTQISLFFVIKKGYFNYKSTMLFKRGGILILISGLLNLILGIALFWSNKEDVYINNILRAFPIVLIGFGLIIISDFLKKGNQLKSENDLTI